MAGMAYNGKHVNKEKNSYSGGRSDSKVKTKKGPAVAGARDGNPTKSGGINRKTKG